MKFTYKYAIAAFAVVAAAGSIAEAQEMKFFRLDTGSGGDTKPPLDPHWRCSS